MFVFVHNMHITCSLILSRILGDGPLGGREESPRPGEPNPPLLLLLPGARQHVYLRGRFAGRSSSAAAAIDVEEA